MDVSKELENQRVILDHEIHKKMFFIQSRLYMAIQGCILMLRFGAQKLIQTFLRSPKITRYSGVVYFSQNLFFKIKGCLSVIGVVFLKFIFGHFKSPKIAQNSVVVSFLNFKIFIYWRCQLTYLATNTENRNLRTTEFKVLYSEASILTIKTTIYVYTKRQYILCLYRDTCYILFSI